MRIAALSRTARAVFVALVALFAVALTVLPASRPADAAAIPAQFKVSSTSWTSPNQGWVLGYAPCGLNRCPWLLRTTDGGRHWSNRVAPPLSVPDTSEQVRIVFDARGNGFATDGTLAYSTHDGATGAWTAVRLAGSLDVRIGAVAVGDAEFFAIATTTGGEATSTGLYLTPRGRDAWAPAPGVSVPGSGVPANGGWDIATNGGFTAVSLGVIFESTRYWTRSGTGPWTERTAPCTPDMVTSLAAVPDRVAALCSYNPGIGMMFKDLFVSTGTGPFEARGRAPDFGLTQDVAATGPDGSTVAVVGVGRGGSFVHATFDGGATWQTPLVIPADAPLYDLSFQDARHGVFVWGGPPWSAGARLYRTTDGGHTWISMRFRP